MVRFATVRSAWVLGDKVKSESNPSNAHANQTIDDEPVAALGRHHVGFFVLGVEFGWSRSWVFMGGIESGDKEAKYH